ncbi:MAG: hypothetical protein N3E51_01270 [Candidatus Micrarchaeota archaeon]|nr:hypothetical protein [Candidatus Micrarchaeota archaeon]
MKAQGSSEYLMLLAAVLVIAIVVVSLLLFYPKVTPDIRQTQSELYWSTAKPIAIVGALGGRTSYSCSSNAQGFLLKLKNMESSRIYIRGINISGSTNSPLFVEGDIVVGQGGIAGEPIVSTENFRSCTGLLHRNLSCPDIVLNPKKEKFVVVMPAFGFCSSVAQGWNSINPYVLADVDIYYETRGLLKLQRGTQKLFIPCHEYFYCKSNEECEDLYGRNFECVSGTCLPSSCT